MPTSHNMIIYALAAGGKVSIGALIAAGLLPALVLMVCMLVAAYAVAVKRGYPAGKFPGWRAVFRSLRGRSARPSDRRHHPGGHPVRRVHGNRIRGRRGHLDDPADVLRLPHHDLAELPAALRPRRCKTTGVVLLLIGVSTMFQYLMGLYEVADFAGELMSRVSTQPWVIFLLINVILFVLGTFMDMAATILICTPIFLPIAMKAAWIRCSSAC